MYLVVQDNKPLNALHDMKDRKLLDNSVFEQLRELYYSKLKHMIEDKVKELLKEKQRLIENEPGNTDEIERVDSSYRSLLLLNLVRYQDTSEHGEFTKHILDMIDGGRMGDFIH